MQFSKLRLSGFKSFVDETELKIQPGLTGIVGPNGCGKSNLVEALKWVMGETSAKQMRGGEMDDIIFAGSENRPARNIAEVGLDLDNSDRTAPSQFNESDDLEVTRKIEREKGSTYKVNSKEVRARDVHLLFADAASGARSTALVSQGQIGEVVSAKPSERRKLLEEAAGISGLYSRRHEAELRLKGAETNLERLEDIMATLEAQLLALRKQVRQATRYRNLNDHVRKAEATLFLIHWTSTKNEKQKNKEALDSAKLAVTKMTKLTSAASVEQAEAATHLPELRKKEVGAAAALQRYNLARENLEQEETRLEAQKTECEKRLRQIDQDIGRENTLVEDASSAIKNLEQEQFRINDVVENQNTDIKSANEQLGKAKFEYEEKENILVNLTQKAADQEALYNDLGRRREEIESRVNRLRISDKKIKEEITQLQNDAIEKSFIKIGKKKLANAIERLDELRKQAKNSEVIRGNANRRLNEAQLQAQDILSKSAKLEAEVKALSEILETNDRNLWPPLIDALTVEAGLESALGAALGDDLNASTNESAPIHWRELEKINTYPSLPEGADPLSNYVKGPKALLSRLSQIGIVSDTNSGWHLAKKLEQGQRLITRDGAFWRWDGFSAAAEAPTPAAIRLQQRNRLSKARRDLEHAKKQNNIAKSNIEAAQKQTEKSLKDEKFVRDAIRDAEIKRDLAQNELAQLQRQTLENDTKISALENNAMIIAADLKEAEKSQNDIAQIEIKAEDLEESRKQVNSLRAIVAKKRTKFVEAQSNYDTVNNKAEERRNRLQAIKSQMTNWNSRKEEALIQLDERTERKKALETEQKYIAQQPTEIKRRHDEILHKVEEAETHRNKAADSLAEAETTLANADRNLREAETKLSTLREQRVRTEASVDQTELASKALIERISDRLNCSPDELYEFSGIEIGAELPKTEKAEKRVERLLRERENMGPVNLLAESEAEELTEQIQTLKKEREDLINAVSKLRRGINELNREGRQRLLESFEEVNKHFQKLFVRLFGGGRAHIELIESEDPLDAGLEIMASPPGKRLQVLSLLSGGEQALTALSLLFAVFMQNPAPICVLDEVDAPLDDTNVDRFCTMVDELALNLSTRFLVVTHHRMTMARMERLFGVTMGEQGVSQLVSVSLGEAIELRDIA
ncbi:MAG: chromosome segregation protein SMC [Pseudomonadota bacterium]|nr:chromosome segregation protein SMC [Pseudomonadota bacterium]